MIFLKRKVILVTDGDANARRAVEMAATRIGGRCISRSAGNPTPLSGEEIIELVKTAKYDPVIVMVDDKGNPRQGQGEQVIEEILKSDEIEVLGVIAVASNTEGVNGVAVDFSINSDGERVERAVNKCGRETNSKVLYGDTVDILNKYRVPVIVGIGDIGKMNGKDDSKIGAPVLTRAIEEILKIAE
ncbi:stage V sporulation protein AE [Caloranaerobacter azorensis]|uniref:stage V sporulation protein AE n=1 Tax=Caloranaerobacter azorensis TaxID=116090 RepID=UPI00241E167F|nr:stage V sporulation protein AE [Caloranaerobacter azorensis]